jgi:hypothetical protein
MNTKVERQGFLFNVCGIPEESLVFTPQQPRLKEKEYEGPDAVFDILPEALPISLGDAQLVLASRLEDGGDCPCCGRFSKIYARPINATMSRSLCWLVQAFKTCGAWINVPVCGPKFVLRSKQLSTLQWWRLIEPKPNDNPKVKTVRDSGLWRPTQRGIDFVEGKIRVPRKVLTLFGNVIGYSSDEVSIQDTLDAKFDYEDAMAPVAIGSLSYLNPSNG